MNCIKNEVTEEQNVHIANDLEKIATLLPIKKKILGKKPQRSCLYCQVFVTKLSRQIKTVHEDFV